MKKIIVNAGHGPTDPGAVGPNGIEERNVALSVSNHLAAFLQGVGYEVQVIQSDDLAEICALANDWPADVFVSVHCNSAGDSSAKGTEVWYCDGDDAGERLAECIENQIVGTFATIDRGVKDAKPGRNGLYVLTNTNMMAVLVELAFISNHKEEAILANPINQKQFGAAVARGVTDYDQEGG